MRLPTAGFDPIVLELETFFVVDKFISIFCFLFGVGFALQMRRASECGADVRRLYLRRMLWLFLFGVASGADLLRGHPASIRRAGPAPHRMGFTKRSNDRWIGARLRAPRPGRAPDAAFGTSPPHRRGDRSRGGVQGAVEYRSSAPRRLRPRFLRRRDQGQCRGRMGLALDRRRANEGGGELWEDPPRILGRSHRHPSSCRFICRECGTRRLCRHAHATRVCMGAGAGRDVFRAFFSQMTFSPRWIGSRGSQKLDGLGSGTQGCSPWRRPTFARSSSCSGVRLGGDSCTFSRRWAGWLSRTTLVKASSASLSSTGWGSVGPAASAQPLRLGCPSASSWYRCLSARGGSGCSDSGRPSGLGDRSHTGGDNRGGRH